MYLYVHFTLTYFKKNMLMISIGAVFKNKAISRIGLLMLSFYHTFIKAIVKSRYGKKTSKKKAKITSKRALKEKRHRIENKTRDNRVW